MSDALKPAGDEDAPPTRLERWMENAWISAIKHPRASMAEAEPEPVPRRLRVVSLAFKGSAAVMGIMLTMFTCSALLDAIVDGVALRHGAAPALASSAALIAAVYWTGVELERRSRLAGVTAVGTFLYAASAAWFSVAEPSYTGVVIAGLGLASLASVWKELR